MCKLSWQQWSNFGGKAFSSPEPTILLAGGRNRELWEQPFQACAIDADYVRPDGQNSVISFVISKWLLPELSIPAAGQKDRRLWGREWREGDMLFFRLVEGRQVKERKIPFVFDSKRECFFPPLSQVIFWRLHDLHRRFSSRKCRWIVSIYQNSNWVKYLFKENPLFAWSAYTFEHVVVV